ncbi:MAG: hypothetical protein ACOY4R_08355 [Pseudomonadota bacterium]
MSIAVVAFAGAAAVVAWWSGGSSIGFVGGNGQAMEIDIAAKTPARSLGHG